jgi:acyl-coenzyme A synthetase/AMP-(fatty) acid ligase
VPSPAFLAALVEHARQRPNDYALIFHDKRITYGQLLDLVAEAAGRVSALGVPERSTVCVSAKKSPDMIALIIACLSGRRRVLVPAVDLTEGVLTTLCQVSGCASVLTVRSSADGHSEVAIRQVGEAGPGDAPAWPRPRPEGEPDAEHAGLLLTTSGSTGIPKVVPISWTSADRFMGWAAEQFGLAPGITVLSYAPLNFDLSLLDVWATLRAGGCVLLVDQDRATDTGYLCGLFDSEIHVVQAVPMFYRLLADGAETSGRTFNSGRHLVFTGDVASPGLALRLHRLFPNARYYNLYGCTETNDSLMHGIDPATLHDADRIPLGRPLPGVDALIVDADGKLVIGPGVGELWVTTPFQTAGYLESWRNGDTFVQHPDGTSPGTYYRTGDIIARRTDGTYLLEGRDVYHVKVRGVRINTQEIESAILDHPRVREVVVVALPDDLAGARLHALVQRHPGSGLNSLVLRAYCAKRLPRMAIPASISIIDEPVPRTPTGKPDRNLVKQSQIEKGLTD